MSSKIIIGDVHGQFAALSMLFEQFPSDFNDDDICFVGDLIDRGPESRKVIEFVRERGFDMCQGNHEEFMIQHDSIWQHKGVGGSLTLDNYRDAEGNLDREAIKETTNWMMRLPLYLEYEDVKDTNGRHLVVSHSSIAAVWHLRRSYSYADVQRLKDVVLWERNLAPEPLDDIYNVFGHTPQQSQPLIKEHFACIDGGSFKTWESGFGYIYALQFPEMRIYKQQVFDRTFENIVKS